VQRAYRRQNTKNHSNSAQQKSVNQVCILKVHSYQSGSRSILSILTAAAQLWSLSSSSDRPYDDDARPKVCKLATYINALGTGELLPRSGDFSGAEPFHPTTIAFAEKGVLILLKYSSSSRGRRICNSWRAGGQQEGLQYNGEAAWWKVIGVYIISADEKKFKLALPKRS
jgi:hypothetical protein